MFEISKSVFDQILDYFKSKNFKEARILLEAEVDGERFRESIISDKQLFQINDRKK